MNKSILAFTTALSLCALTPALAQDMTGVDPACIMKNADGTETVDKVKCPDGKTMGAMQNQGTEQPGTNATTQTEQPADSTTSTTTQTEQPADSTTSTTGSTATQTEQPADSTTTGSTTMPQTTTERTIIVPADQLNGVNLMSASDYIGKRVYDQAGNDIGEVNDLIISADGNIQATILGVGGFLGMGEKDVAVPVASIDMVKDGDSMKLVVNATKEQLEAAPTYDRLNRRYAG